MVFTKKKTFEHQLLKVLTVNIIYPIMSPNIIVIPLLTELVGLVLTCIVYYSNRNKIMLSLFIYSSGKVIQFAK